MYFRALILTLAIHIGGCATPGAVRLEGQNIPLTQLQRAAIGSLPQGKRRVSVNGREMFSNHFVLKRGRYEKARGSEKHRYLAHVLVLGDRRPYTIEVVVYKEQRGHAKINQSYHRVGIDKGIARVILRRIQKLLSKRREDLNIIDDFRVF